MKIYWLLTINGEFETSEISEAVKQGNVAGHSNGNSWTLDLEDFPSSMDQISDEISKGYTSGYCSI